MSGLLGIVFGVLTMGLVAVSAPMLLVEAAGWLTGVNLMLTLFNLLPGAPLDGGRIVRALAWRLGRDRLAASLLAIRIGRLLGFGLFALGAIELVVGTDLSGLWLMVLGIFMTGAAAAEGRQEVVQHALDGARVSDAMQHELRQVPGGLTVDVLIDSVLVPDRLGAALVVEPDGATGGVVSLARAMALKPDARRETRARDVAEPIASLPTATPNEPLLPALERIRPSGGPLLVLDHGVIAGIVEPADVARLLRARTTDATPPAPHGAPGPVG